MTFNFTPAVKDKVPDKGPDFSHEIKFVSCEFEQESEIKTFVRPQKQLTVGELVELLKNENQDLHVLSEGCDCMGEATHIRVEDGNLIIGRAI